MKFKHYTHDDQLEGHKAREREKARLELVERIRAKERERVNEILKKWKNGK